MGDYVRTRKRKKEVIKFLNAKQAKKASRLGLLKEERRLRESVMRDINQATIAGRVHTNKFLTEDEYKLLCPWLKKLGYEIGIEPPNGVAGATTTVTQSGSFSMGYASRPPSIEYWISW